MNATNIPEKLPINKIDSKDYIEINYSEESLIDLIAKTCKLSWRNSDKIGLEEISCWLNNFKGEVFEESYERKLALILLANFVYYNSDDIRHLCKVIKEKYIHDVIEKMGISKEEALDSTRFIPLGTPAESAAHLSYPFRQMNDMRKDLFCYDIKEALADKNVRNIVFIDDVSLTGTQADGYLKDILKKAKITLAHISKKNKNLYAIFLIAAKEAYDLLRLRGISVISAVYLDERSKSFSNASCIFKLFGNDDGKVIKEYTERLALYYGYIAIRNHYKENGKLDLLIKKYGNKTLDILINDSLGFANSQLMFSMDYNTPDNTLPIFWGNINWNKLFIRYDKIYGKTTKGGGDNGFRYV